MTGATGLIGGEVARRLVANGHRVTALVNRRAEVRGNDGALVPVAGAVRGDVAAERLGWDAATHRTLAAAQDLVIHCAASVRFDLTEAEYDRVNVGGTAQAVALARAGGCALLHVSTAYVCGRTDGPVAEGPVAPGADFANGYERSKAVGEAVVEGSGLRWTIARPSIVLGDHAAGRIRQFDTLYTAFRLIAAGLIRQLPVTPNATLDFVPIDHVAGGLVDLAEGMVGDGAGAGRHVHLTAESPVSLPAFRDSVARQPGFTAPTLVPVDRFDAASLAPRERRVWRASAGVYQSYFARSPRFVADRLERLSGRRCPSTDAAWLDRLMRFGVTQGFLPAPPDAGA